MAVQLSEALSISLTHVHTQSLVNKGPTQLLAIKTVAKIVTVPPSFPLVHPPLLFSAMGNCVAMDSVVMATNNYADDTGSGEG